MINAKLYDKKILKKEINIVKEKITSFKLLFKIDDKLLTGRKPPEAIKVIDRLNASNDLILKKLNVINITNVSVVYKIKILKDCLTISEVLNERKLVKDFFKLLSNISISKIIEKRKYSPPIH